MNARWLDEDSDALYAPERAFKRKTKKPLGRRRLADLITAASGGRDADPADETIRRLTDLGYITRVVAELKSGKEATAYVARGPRGTLLLKLLLAATFPMSGDEAFFYQWGVFPAWGYSDHPPMVGWLLPVLHGISDAPLVLRSVTLLVTSAIALLIVERSI